MGLIDKLFVLFVKQSAATVNVATIECPHKSELYFVQKGIFTNIYLKMILSNVWIAHR